MKDDVLAKCTRRMTKLVVSDRLLEDTVLEARRRKPILVAVLLISTCSAAMMSIGLGILYAYTGAILHLAATLMALFALLGYAGTLWYFIQRQQWMPATHLYGATLTFSTVMPCVITGGILLSPYLPLVLVVPTFLFLMAGRKYGIYWSLVAAGCVGLLFMLETAGVDFPQAISDDLLMTFSFTTWLMTLMLLVIALVSYEMNFERLTEEISAERTQFAYAAMHDSLTGLSNRTLFYARARESVQYALSHDHKAALIFIDLNDFKLVNDGLGHEAGDTVLNTIADRLQKCVRSVDTVARLGGDEFALVLYGVTDTEMVNTVVKKLASVLSEPLVVGDNILRTSGSFGVAIAPDQGTEVEHLLRVADQAMYSAKALRKNSRTDDRSAALKLA